MKVIPIQVLIDALRKQIAEGKGDQWLPITIPSDQIKEVDDSEVISWQVPRPDPPLIADNP
jgi:hypothetical protein